MALEENKYNTEIAIEILEKLQNIEYNVSMNSKDIESIKKEIRTRIIDWIINFTLSGGLIYLVISYFLNNSESTWLYKANNYEIRFYSIYNSEKTKYDFYYFFGSNVR